MGKLISFLYNSVRRSKLASGDPIQSWIILVIVLAGGRFTC